MTNQNIASTGNSMLSAHETQNQNPFLIAISLDMSLSADNHLNFLVDQSALSLEQCPTIWASFGTKFQYPASPFHCKAHKQCTYLISSQTVAIQVERCPIHTALGSFTGTVSDLVHQYLITTPRHSRSSSRPPASSPPATLTHLLREVYVRTEHRARTPYRPV
jgi:hypothetical protein